MKTSQIACLAAVLGLFAATQPVLANGTGIKIGVLTCDVAPGAGLIVGSNKAVDCVFKPNHGKPDSYTGNIGRIGPDIGFTDATTLTWAVVAPGKVHRGALAGA